MNCFKFSIRHNQNEKWKTFPNVTKMPRPQSDQLTDSPRNKNRSIRWHQNVIFKILPLNNRQVTGFHFVKFHNFLLEFRWCFDVRDLHLVDLNFSDLSFKNVIDAEEKLKIVDHFCLQCLIGKENCNIHCECDWNLAKCSNVTRR